MSTHSRQWTLPVTLVLIFLLASLSSGLPPVPEPTLADETVPAETGGGSRHVYTFADGSAEAVALYQAGTPSRAVQVALPLGAEVTAAEFTLSGASATGWSSVAHSDRAHWESGTPNAVDPRGDDVTLAMQNADASFVAHDLDSTSSSASAWYDNASYSIRQPHTTNSSEARFSAQRSIQASVGGTYNGAVFKYRDMLFASTWSSQYIHNTMKALYPNNATVIQGANNQPVQVHLDKGACSIPAPSSTWQGYGWRDWAVTDDERVFGLLSTYRGSNANQYHRIVEWDIRHPFNWKCNAVYDVSTQGYGDYTAISFDRTRDSIWVNHDVRKTVVQYEFDGMGGFTRNSTDYYTYFMSNGHVRGMEVHGNLFYFRKYLSWSQDKLECFAITGDPGSTLTKQQGQATISMNGYGMHYDGQRFNTLDHYSWSGNQMYREFGTGLTYLITAQPGTSTWISEPMELSETIVVANVETAWSITAAGDRVDYWVSADNGTHWVQVTNNETVHFQYPGTALRWKVQLVGTTAVSWWVDIQYATEYASTGEWLSPVIPTGTQVGQMRAQWSATVPAGTEIGIMVTNDNGTNWVWAENNVIIDWGTSVGNKLRYNVVLNSTDSDLTPALHDFELHFEEGYPSNVKIDIGDDNSNEYVGSGGLQDPVIISGDELVDAFNDHIPQNGLGTTNITLTLRASSPGRVRFTDLDITYRFRTRVLDANVEGGLLVPDGVDRMFVARVALGDDATHLARADITLISSASADPVLRWEAGNTCSTVSDPDGLVQFDAGNCSSQESNRIVSLRMPIQSTWDWNDESGTEATFTVDDNLGRAVDDWTSTDLNLRVENDIQLLDMSAEDETGRTLAAYDWMRGGLNLTFSGRIAFEGTSLSPKAGQFDLRLTGQNVTQDGEPAGDIVDFVIEANPAHGQYYITIQTPMQSSQGGMLFRLSATSLANTSSFINPEFNTMRIVLDGNSPLVIGATPTEGMQLHAGQQPISVTIQDSVDPPTQINLHYWVEGVHDLNYNLLPDADEYESEMLRSPEHLPGGIIVFNGIVDDSWNEHGEKVSFYVSGEDQQGNEVALGGGPVCPGAPVFCGNDPTHTPPEWDADLATYTIREEFQPEVQSDNSTIIGHDDETPLHPGTEYVARIIVGDGNGATDIQSLHLSLIGDFADERGSIFANFTRPEAGHVMTLESASTAIAVSNLYSDVNVDPTNESLLVLAIRFQLTWLFPEEFDTDGEETFSPAVEITDWPCDIDSDVPCHEDRGGMAFDEWSLDNDLRFDMAPGHFLATDLATGRNLFRPNEDPELIAAGQVVRVAGRILFSEDATPAPEGAFDIVVGDLERSWSAVPREGGDFTLDILVPNVRSGSLDMYAWLDNMPGLASDETTSRPRIQLIVDGDAPEIRALGPDGDIRLDQAAELPVSLHVADEQGFNPENPAEIHWFIRAGTSEISRGNKQFDHGSPVGTDWMWAGSIDLTDDGSIQLLPGYVVDVWVTGSDAAGNPYLATNNTEATPLGTWRLIRVGPDIDLRDGETTIDWQSPTVVGGENATLDLSGINLNEESGAVSFHLMESIDGRWIHVNDVSSSIEVGAEEAWATTLELPTTEVTESEVHRYQLVARDGHVDIDWLTIEPLTLTPPTARDGEALGQQIEEGTGVFVLYIIALASLAFAVATMVILRKERTRAADELTQAQLDQTAVVDGSFAEEDMPMPPMPAMPGMPEMPPMPAEPTVPLSHSDATFAHTLATHGIHDAAAFLVFANQYDADGNGYLRASELNAAAAAYVEGGHNQATATPAYSDEQLMAGGWTQEQIDAAREAGTL